MKYLIKSILKSIFTRIPPTVDRLQTLSLTEIPFESDEKQTLTHFTPGKKDSYIQIDFSPINIARSVMLYCTS